MKELRCSGPLLLSKKGAELDLIVVVVEIELYCVAQVALQIMACPALVGI